jgi:predicted permease
MTIVQSTMRDIRYAARSLLRQRGFTAIAVVTLALGIGANTAIFSLIDAVLLKMLPVEQPEQLYFIQNVGPQRPNGGAPPYPCFERFRDQNQTFDGLAAFTTRDLRVRIDGEREQVSAQLVSGNYFSLLGVGSSLGRTLNPTDDSVPGKGGPEGYAAVISYNYWTRRFGRNPAVVGKVVQIGKDAVTIVGVTQPEFYGLVPGTEIDISLPIMFQGAGALAENSSWWFKAVGRLKPDVSVAQAQADLNAIFQPFISETDVSPEMRRDYFARIELAPASKGLDTLRRQFSKPLQALMFIVALVLMIACANVANLILARGSERRKEFAIRLALGASRSRLIRELLTESLLLVSLGGLLGVSFALWSEQFLTSFFVNGDKRLAVNLSLDYRVLCFTACVSLLTGLIFGLAPAFQATRIDPTPALKDSAVSGAASRSRLGKSLVAAQVALSMLLLVGAGLFLRTLHNLKNVDAGFRRAGVLTMRVNPALASADQLPQLAHTWNEILTRVESLPGVQSASLSTLTPLDGNDRAVRVDVPGFRSAGEQDRDIRLNQVSPAYFRTFGIPQLQGRNFADSDNETALKVAILNETAAHFYFGGRSPIGGLLNFDRGPNPRVQYQVVGVVKDSRYLNLREPETRLVYLPRLQALDQLGQLQLAVHSEGRPDDLVNGIRNELRATGADILVTNIITLDEQINQSLSQERLVSTLSIFFGLLALLLACVGLYGVMAYNVARRTREIGIRMALGARRGIVLSMVLKETLLTIVTGVIVGLAAAIATTRFISSLLFGLTPHDPATFAWAALLLIGVAALAGYIPARRATKVDPMVALRYE